MTVREHAIRLTRRHPGLCLVAMPCAVLAVVVLAVWPTGQVSAADRAAALTGVVPVGQHRPAPDFTRPLLTGTRPLSLHQLRGRVVVVSFWASWCTACRREAPSLQRLAAQELPNGVRFLGVDQQDTRAAARAFLDRFRPGYPSAFDPDGSVLRAYGGIGLPSTFIIDRSGEIRYEAIGAFQTDPFQQALDDVAAA